MKNGFIKNIETSVDIKVEGRNIERFLKRLYSHEIPILKIKNQTYKGVIICIYEKDLETVLSLKTTYEITVLEQYGFGKLKKWFYKNIFLFGFLVLGYICLLLLTNTIFNVEVIHNDPNLRNLLYQELEHYGIKKYKFKKSYQQIEKIKKQIIEAHKDSIEWMEIEETGTKYIIRVEERILNKDDKNNELQEIIAAKPAIIKGIEAKSGEIVKNINDYVKPGDVVISGNLKIYEEVKNQVRAEGTIYGEVWYNVEVEYPLHYYEELVTGKKKTVYSLHFLNNHFDFFNFKPFKQVKSKDSIIVKNNVIPFSIVKEEQQEVKIINETYTKEEAIKKAFQEAREKIETNLTGKEHIINMKELKVVENDSKIVVDIFVTVYEDITGTQKLEPLEQKQE